MSAVTANFDALVTNPGRLRILTALASGERQEFVHLRSATGLTDGNLCSHTRVLESAGLVAVHKSFRNRKPVTHVVLTSTGRAALEQHANQLLMALGLREASRAVTPVPESFLPEPLHADDWVD